MPLLAESYDVALLDLDGVIYIGTAAVPYAVEALDASRAHGLRLAFVTNNAARPPSTVADHLTSLGVAALPDEVVTSAQAAGRILADVLPAGARVLVVGGEGLAAALTEHGLQPVWLAKDDPAAVVQGFSPDVGWRQLAEGAYALGAGIPWVASNLDTTIPTPHGRAPGNGTLVEVLRMVSGRTPVVSGKPEPPMHREAMLRSGASRPLVVGDRLDTDIEGANRSSVDSLLVFTGVTEPEDLVRAPGERRPTYVGEDLRTLLAAPDRAVVLAGRCEAPGWSAAVESGRVVVQRRSDNPNRIDALRVVCGAVWDAADLPTGIDDALTKGGW